MPAVKKGKNFGASQTNIGPFLFCQGFGSFFCNHKRAKKKRNHTIYIKKPFTNVLNVSYGWPLFFSNLFFSDFSHLKPNSICSFDSNLIYYNHNIILINLRCRFPCKGERQLQFFNCPNAMIVISKCGPKLLRGIFSFLITFSILHKVIEIFFCFLIF